MYEEEPFGAVEAQKKMKSGVTASKAFPVAGLERLLTTPGLALGVFETPESQMSGELARAIRKLERAFAGRVRILRITNVRHGRLARSYTIDRVPTLVFWNDGRELARMEGALAPAAVRAQLEFLSGTEDGHVGNGHTH